MDKPIKALLFDMDGLLLDSEREFMEALVEVGGTIGLMPSELRAFFVTLVGLSVEKTSRRLAEFLPAGVDPKAFDVQWRAANAARRLGPMPLRPTVGEVLPRLAKAGHRMAVVTSTKRAPALAHLEQAGLLGYFELVVAGDDVVANKPDPEPYLQAARALGVDPADCAAFEDSDTGTQSAVTAGCLTVQIPDLRPEVPFPILGQRFATDLAGAVAALGLLHAEVES